MRWQNAQNLGEIRGHLNDSMRKIEDTQQVRFFSVPDPRKSRRKNVNVGKVLQARLYKFNISRVFRRFTTMLQLYSSRFWFDLLEESYISVDNAEIFRRSASIIFGSSIMFNYSFFHIIWSYDYVRKLY